MTESRVDLLNWLNSTLNLNYTKVEQLGSGAAYCQLIDSIYLDVPIHRVKFDATKEYEYLNNFKVLQSAFVKHKISKTIPIERLVKCRFQDNLEFFQWIRKFWKENKDESEYDPELRRKQGPTATTRPSSTTPAVRSSSATSNTKKPIRTVSNPKRVVSNGTLSSSSTSSRVNSNNIESELNQSKLLIQEKDIELNEYKIAVDALETERNFYFNKLREIEILTESTNEILSTSNEETPSLKDILIKIQEVLYSTEEGFQIPDDENDIMEEAF